VRGFEPGRHLLCDAHRVLKAKAGGQRGESIRQRLALDELEDQRPEAARFFQSVERGDVGMVQRGEDLGFALEARETRRVERESRGLSRLRPLALTF
jgi:hypothetical protein